LLRLVVVVHSIFDRVVMVIVVACRCVLDGRWSSRIFSRHIFLALSIFLQVTTYLFYLSRIFPQVPTYLFSRHNPLDPRHIIVEED